MVLSIGIDKTVHKNFLENPRKIFSRKYFCSKFKIKMISIVRLKFDFFVCFISLNIYGVQAMGTENEPSDRLEGSDGSQRGGLVIKKKPKKDDSGDGGFKKPSIYGLEKRAKEKREEQRRESEREKMISSRDKKYRERRIETPSNTGGVSDKYRERRREREDYERSKRNYVSSRDRDRRDRDDDRERGSRDNWEDDDDDRRSRRGSHRSWETPTPGRTPRESPSPYVGSRFVHSITWGKILYQTNQLFLDQNEVILEEKKLQWQHQVINIMNGDQKRLIIKVP